jgi:hypothetical protein
MLSKLLLLPALALVLQAQIQVPQLGSVRCSDGTVRPVFGVPAAFVLGKPLASAALSASFSDKGGIVASTSAVRLLEATGKPIGEFKVADPGVIVDIETDPSSALAWLPLTSSLLMWDGAAFQQLVLPSPPAGRVSALRRDGSRAFLLVAEPEGGVSEDEISLDSGNINSVRYLPGVTGPAFSAGAFVLFPDPTGLAINGPTGSNSIPIPGSGLRMEKMTGDWIHITTANSNRHWALHVTSGTLQLFQLPGIPGSKESK